MTRTASKETVGECIICEGSGCDYSGIRAGKWPGWFLVHDATCTHCHGSGLRPQKLVCPLCHGIGGFSKKKVDHTNRVTAMIGPTITHTCCPLCNANGFTLLRLTHGQQFESQEVLP